MKLSRKQRGARAQPTLYTQIDQLEGSHSDGGWHREFMHPSSRLIGGTDIEEPS